MWRATQVDEVGYLAHDPDAANVLFHLVNERHLKKRAMVFTTNKELSVWGQVLHDNDLGEAIVDRILERGRLIRLDGPSVRSRHLGPSNLSPLEAESPAPEPHPNRPEFPEQLRPEFPEPTRGGCVSRRHAATVSSRAVGPGARS